MIIRIDPKITPHVKQAEYICYHPKGQPIVWVFKVGTIHLQYEDGWVVNLLNTNHEVVFGDYAEPISKLRLTRLIDSLPLRFRWMPYNLIAHPLSEALFQLGFEALGNKLHDATVPTHEKGTGRG